MTDKLSGRCAVISGGSRGIGAEVAVLLASNGADIAFCHHRDEDNARRTMGRIEAAGRRALSCECDVADAAAVAAFADRVDREMGVVDIVVNCAGIAGDIEFEALTPDVWTRMISVNLTGTYLLTHAFYPGMKKRGHGRVINFASQLAYKGAPGLAHYCAAKAGVVGFTRALAYEAIEHGINVNAVAPGPIDTDMLRGLSDEWRAMKASQLPIRRFGRPEEIAPTVLLLAGDEGSYYVGQTLSPNGGDVML